MKLTVKPKIEATEQLNLRVPVSLKQRIDHVRKLADEAGVDYNATLVGVLEQFNSELELQLEQRPGKAESASNPASTALAQPRAEQRALAITVNGHKALS